MREEKKGEARKLDEEEKQMRSGCCHILMEDDGSAGEEF